MARHLRVEYPGAIYHVTCRMIGDHRLDLSRLFRDDADRQRFIVGLAERVEQYNIRLYLYVLMTNHFHLVFETPDGNCSKFMQSLTTAYTVYYNLRHSRHGHLLDGRFKSKLVEGDAYLLALSRYVHLNPVQVGTLKGMPLKERIKELRLYSWSSYPGYIDKRRRQDFMQYGPLLSEMKGKQRDWPKRYREFVETGLADKDDDMQDIINMSPRSIGGDRFRAWVDELHQKAAEKGTTSEDIALRRMIVPLTAEEILGSAAEEMGVRVEDFKIRCRGMYFRGIASLLLVKYAGITQRDVAGLLGLGTGVAVSLQIKKVREAMSTDKSVARQVEKMIKRLDSIRKTKAKENRQ